MIPSTFKKHTLRFLTTNTKHSKNTIRPQNPRRHSSQKHILSNHNKTVWLPVQLQSRLLHKQILQPVLFLVDAKQRVIRRTQQQMSILLVERLKLHFTPASLLRPIFQQRGKKSRAGPQPSQKNPSNSTRNGCSRPWLRSTNYHSFRSAQGRWQTGDWLQEGLKEAGQPSKRISKHRRDRWDIRPDRILQIESMA